MTLVPVGKGGSDRDYFRVTVPGRDPFILMRYGRFARGEQLLRRDRRFSPGDRCGGSRIFGHDPERGLLLMEDLGDEDLFAFRNAPWDLRRRLYEKTLAIVSRLHAFPPDRFPAGDIRLMPGFGAELYRWERDYFREQCVTEDLRHQPDSDAEEEALETELGALAGASWKRPRRLFTAISSPKT